MLHLFSFPPRSTSTKKKGHIQMASVSASQVMSRSSHFNSGGTCNLKPKLCARSVACKRIPSLRNQAMSYHGLRSLNQVDLINMQTNSKATSQQARRKGYKNTNGRTFGVIAGGSGMNLIFVGSEVAPWSKTGGLGDIIGGLPPAMAANGHRVMTVTPRYDQYKDSWDTGVTVELKVGDNLETVRFFHCYKRGVDHVFVDHPIFLKKVLGKTDEIVGTDYQDYQLQFSLLCQAALEAPRVLNLNNSKYFSEPYGEDVVFIANDWHTALIPCYLKSMYKPHGIYKNAKVVFCIHNIAYQGRFAFWDFELLNLPNQFERSFDFFDGYARYFWPVKGRKINWMKAGILESDRVLTVSPYYAQELISGFERGVELETIIRKTGITGIVNGMDVEEWNPLTDKYISVNYDHTTVLDAKPFLKEALQAEVGLPVDKNIPLIGFIGGLEKEKGSDILVAAIPEIVEENVQIVVLGTGVEYMEKQLEQLEVKYPEKARGVAKFNVPLAHMITAGADFMIVPSRFEPCGLIQLHAMRYGTVSIVASTGGLVDTVKDGVTGFHIGEAFNIDVRVVDSTGGGASSVDCEAVDPADATAVATTVKRALAFYRTPYLPEMIKNCMAQDLSWMGPAKQWEEVLLSLGVGSSEPGINGEEIAPLAKENVATRLGVGGSEPGINGEENAPPAKENTVVLKVVVPDESSVWDVYSAMTLMEGCGGLFIDMKKQKVTVKGKVQPDAVLQVLLDIGYKASFWEEEATDVEEAEEEATDVEETEGQK
ncbi:granule-bound starch synthase 1, chloroplastic/amyloplastic-like isoform X2 [Tasmannia lanceolata]|uniref:granule-bound starch synthase 1, chloroplastic/amyloplastic-like isoform X2 n=1 Tax=Tasmannia lanceolata TaxID=3420 RepID=UPI0040647863